MSTKKFLNGLLVLALAATLGLFMGVASPASAAPEDSPPPSPADTWYDPDDAPGGDVDPIDRRIERIERAREHTGDNKILFSGLAPGTVVSHYVVDGADTPVFNDMGQPNGTLVGSQPAPLDGKPLELFAPVSDTTQGPSAKVNNFFTWSEENGWSLIDSLIALPSSTDTEL